MEIYDAQHEIEKDMNELKERYGIKEFQKKHKKQYTQLFINFFKKIVWMKMLDQ